MGKGIIITEAGQGAPFRKMPSVDAEMIGVFEPNTQIDLESYDNGWYATTFEGEQGFIAAKFVQAQEGIEGLDGKKVKAAKSKTKKTSKKSAKAKPAISEAMVKTNADNTTSTANSGSGIAKKLKKKMTKAEKAKLYEANKIISIERTDKGLQITLEGTDGFNGFDGFDDENLMNGLMDKLKDGIKKAAAKIKPEVTKITSRGVYEANKAITIKRTDNGFQVGIQGINGFDGIDGLDDEETLNGLLKKIGNGIKNVTQKIVGGAQKIADVSNNVSQTVENVKNTSANAVETTASLKVNAANALEAAKSTAASAEKLRAAGVLDENNNISPTAKKIVIGAGIALGATLIGLIALRIVKNKKPAPVATPTPTPLSGVRKKRRKKVSLE